jgi:hypothetical protein
VITEENSEFGIRNSEPPTTPPQLESTKKYSTGEPDLAVAEGRRGFTQNSKLKTQNSEPLHSLRLISLVSEPGATPRVQGLVRGAAGPWTLEDGWWSERPVERDYWDVELSGGRLYRIYRDRTTGDWFADGMYD